MILSRSAGNLRLARIMFRVITILRRGEGSTRGLRFGVAVEGRHRPKFNDELRSGWLIFFRTDCPLVFLNNLRGDRKTKSRSSLLGREIRQKEPFAHLVSEARSGVRNSKLSHAIFKKARSNTKLTKEALLHRLSGVVNQIADGTLKASGSAITRGRSGLISRRCGRACVRSSISLLR